MARCEFYNDPKCPDSNKYLILIRDGYIDEKLAEKRGRLCERGGNGCTVRDRLREEATITRKMEAIHGA